MLNRFLVAQFSCWRRRFSFWKYRAHERAKRLHRACRYMAGTMSQDDAQWMIMDCESAAGWYPLMILSVDDVLERAREVFVDHPALHEFVTEGCVRVRRKWECYGDELEAAIDWAIESAQEYAASEGITFARLEQADVTENEGEV